MKSISRRQNGQSGQRTAIRRCTRAFLWPMPTWSKPDPQRIANPQTAAAKSVSIRKSPSRKNYRLTYEARVPHGSIPVFMIRAFEAATKDKLCCLPGNENHRLREPSLSRKPDGVPVSALASDRAENPIALAESCRRSLLSLSLQHLTATRSMDEGLGASAAASGSAAPAAPLHSRVRARDPQPRRAVRQCLGRRFSAQGLRELGDSIAMTATSSARRRA